MSAPASGQSGSRLPLALGGGCAGLVLVGIACVGLLACGLVLMSMGSRSPAAGKPGTPAPVARPGTPGPGAQPGTGAQPGAQPGAGTQPGTGAQPGMGGQPGTGPQPGMGAQPGAGPQPGAQPGMGGQPGVGGQAWTLVSVGGFTCDLNTNQCQQRSGGETIQVVPQGDGTILLQTSGGSVRVDGSCRLLNQPDYTFFPCPFYPNVPGFQGVVVTAQGMQPVGTFQATLIDVDFDQDGETNEPGYFNQTSSTLAFSAYRQDGSLKFWGYIVDTQNYSWLYVFLFETR